jgi:NADH-quinone oxidoreductase subunit C
MKFNFSGNSLIVKYWAWNSKLSVQIRFLWIIYWYYRTDITDFNQNWYYNLNFFYDCIEFVVTHKFIVNIALLFKFSYLFLLNCLIDIVTLDISGKLARFSIIYNFFSIIYNFRGRIFTQIPEIGAIQTITKIFYNAGWAEREVWDMFGIYFTDNVDLRRILTDYGFIGHPLKKDFPLTGFSEVGYNSIKGIVDIKPVELFQALRNTEESITWF